MPHARSTRETIKRLLPVRTGVLVLAVLFAGAGRVSAQTTTQVWTNLTFDWLRGTKLTYELDLEPKVLVSAPPGEPGWRNLDVTPSVEYSLRPQMDLIGELTLGRTKQTDDAST